MKKKQVLTLAAAGLAAVALGSAAVPKEDVDISGNYQVTKAYGFYVEEHLVHPHGEGDIPYKFVFRAYRAGLYSVQVRFKYHRGGNHSTGIASNWRNEEVYLNTKWKPKCAGDFLTVSGVWKLKYDWEKRHYVTFMIHYSNNANGTRLHDTIWFSFAGTNEETIVADKFPWKRPFLRELSSHQTFYQGELQGGMDWHIYRTRFIIDGYGFKKSYEDPEMGVIPLSGMRFACTGYDRNPANVGWKSGVLKVFNHVDDWTIGAKAYDSESKRYYRSFPVVAKDIGDETTIELDKTYYVRADGREMRSSNPVGINKKYYKTKQLFLPPNPTSSPRSYDCELYLKGFGEQRSDIFKHEFTVTKTHDAFGSSVNGDFFIEESL